MTNLLLTPDEVQNKLGITRSTLYSWHHKKKFLQPRKVGGSLRYSEKDVEKFIRGDENK